MKLLKILTVIVASLVLVACSNKISYGDATSVETTTMGFGSTDLQN
mgnify:FL=1